MKQTIVALLFLSVVGTCIAGQCQPLPFTNGTISGLTFCTNMNGRSVDSFFQSSWINPATGKTWPQYIDSILETSWGQITSYISTAASNNGFTVCDACLQNIKELMCAGAFPLGGYYNCIYDAIMTFYQTACPELCLCNSNYCCFSGPASDPACANSANRNPAYAPGQISQTCLSNLQKGDFIQLFSSCAATHLPERAACQKMVSTCACVDENDPMAINACKLYSVNGYPYQLTSNGTCTSAQGWCGTSSSGQGSIKINGALSLNAPTPVASEAYSGASGGVTASQTGPNVGVVPTSSHSSDAVALQVSTAVALAAVGVAMMI